MQPRILQFDLYLVTDRSQTHGRELLWVIERALEGGVKGIQLREKDLGGRELLVLAEKVKALCDRYDASLLINDRVDVALAIDAHGVHLAGASIPVEAARPLVGNEKLIGVSTHSAEEAEAAERGGADFVLFGPIYYTPSKAIYGKPQGLALLREVVAKVALPVYAIGGIKREHIGEVKKTGIHGVAVISAVLGADDPCAAAREMITLLKG